MASVVDICNKALDKLGHSPITSLTDGTKAANLCNRAWPLVRDQELRNHPWNFAVTRTTTAPSSESPSWGFTYKHPLPADYLRLLEVRDLSTGGYEIENGHIYADDDTLYIRYIRKETDPNNYDSLFINAVSTALASELCEALTQSNTKKSMLAEEYKDILVDARKVDALENPPIALAEDDWVNARL